MTFQIIDQQPGWLVINKPAGINIHCEGDEPGLMVQLAEQLNHPVWPVHRLDKVTTGCLLIATDANSAALLCEQFSHHRVSKDYIAIAAGKPKKKQGLITGDMARSRNGSWKLCRTKENPAITRFLSLPIPHETMPSTLKNCLPSGTGTVRYYLLKPQTGKTHQLRVAMKSLGTPILGDQRYGPKSIENEAQMLTYLHAWRLQFQWKGQTHAIFSEPDSEKWPSLPDTFID